MEKTCNWVKELKLQQEQKVNKENQVDNHIDRNDNHIYNDIDHKVRIENEDDNDLDHKDTSEINQTYID